MSGVKYKGWSQQSHQKLLIYYRQSDRASLNKRYLDWDADDEQELGRQRKIGRMTQTEGATGMEALRRKWMPWLEEAKVCQHSWAWMWGSRKGGGAYRLGPWLQGLVSSSSLWSVTPNQFQRPTPHQVAEPTSKSLLGLKEFQSDPYPNEGWEFGLAELRALATALPEKTGMCIFNHRHSYTSSSTSFQSYVLL